MQTIHALGLPWLFAMLSPGIASEASMAVVGRYVVIFAAALSALLSLPLLVHPLGYLRNGTGFQVILNHPQVFGPTMALLCAWAGCEHDVYTYTPKIGDGIAHPL